MLLQTRKFQNRFVVHSMPEGYQVTLNTCDDWVAIYFVPYTGPVGDDLAWKRDRAAVAKFLRLVRSHVRRYHF